MDSIVDKMTVQLTGHGSWDALPNGLPVNGYDRHDFHAGIREEAFVGMQQLFRSKSSLVHGDLQFSRYLQQNCSRNAVQKTTFYGWCAEPVLGGEEQIAHGTFCQVAFPIQKERIEDLCRNRFTFRQNVVQEVCGFDLRRECAWQVASRLGYDE